MQNVCIAIFVKLVFLDERGFANLELGNFLVYEKFWCSLEEVWGLRQEPIYTLLRSSRPWKSGSKDWNLGQNAFHEWKPQATRLKTDSESQKTIVVTTTAIVIILPLELDHRPHHLRSRPHGPKPYRLDFPCPGPSDLWYPRSRVFPQILLWRI